MLSTSSLTFSHADAFTLHAPDLAVEPGSSLAVIGPSGSGKTTLLHLLAGILTPDRGQVIIRNMNHSALPESVRRDYRLRHIGLVFQSFELIRHLDVMDNILLIPRMTPGVGVDPSCRNRAIHLAESIGLGQLLHRKPDRLSQGERQRVAICRALLMQPEIVLADEPTGNLDPEHARRVGDILLEYAKSNYAALITVTHDHELAHRFDQQLDLSPAHLKQAGGRHA